ncbi:MAG TPA: hypothetical protein VIK93_04540, partial [Limnochordales bacterium]
TKGVGFDCFLYRDRLVNAQYIAIPCLPGNGMPCPPPDYRAVVRAWATNFSRIASSITTI